MHTHCIIKCDITYFKSRLRFRFVKRYNQSMQGKNAKPLSILVVDDEVAIRDLVIQILELKYQVYSATNTQEALRIAKEHKPSLALVDIYMPGHSGLELCKQLRLDPATKHIPIMIMTARNALETRVKAFEYGADDFLEKPFYMDELVSRIESKIRRFSEEASGNANKVISPSLQDLKLDFESLKANIAGKDFDLGHTEFKILSMLIRQAGSIVARAAIEEYIWGSNVPETRPLDTHIAGLRRKLAASKRLKLRTVYGEGFILESKGLI